MEILKRFKYKSWGIILMHDNEYNNIHVLTFSLFIFL